MKVCTQLLSAVLVVAGVTSASAQTLYDNFETTRIVAYPVAQGVFTQNAPNPGANAVNGSPTCALYTRDAGQQFAVIVAKPNNARMASVAPYAAGTKRISIKFRSPAAGVLVQAVLQNSVKSNTNMYPNGKFGGDFNATTTVANAWETLTFTYVPASGGNFDPTVLATDVDQMVLLVAPNTNMYPNGKFGGDFNATTTVANAWETLTFTYVPASGGNFDPTVLATDVDQMVFLVAPNTNTGATYYLDDIMAPELIAGPTSTTAVSQLYDNYQGTRAIKYIAYKSSGGLNADTLNPAPSAANNSTRVARYTRSNNQYDALVVQPRGAALADVANFKNNTLRMTMKVFSPASGIPFQITLQDSTVANGSNYPAGRNSEYTATTTATNAWETLTFSYLGTPSATPDTGLNEIVLLISANTFARRRVYIDDWTGPSLVGFVPTATRTVQTATAAFAPAYPNPTSGVTQLPFSLQKPAVVSLAVFDNLGRRVAQVLSGENKPAGSFTAELNAASLAPGLYTVRLVVDGVALARPLSVE